MDKRKSNSAASAVAAVAVAAEAFESRWTMRALRRVDRDLHDLFREQEGDYGLALLNGTEAEVEEQAGAMVRGYAALAKRMSTAGEAGGPEPDDAYLVGHDPKTGMTVAIAEQRHALARVRELHGEAVCFVTPDEVASLIAGLEVVKQAKSVFPNCEVIRLTPKEPGDGEAAWRPGE